jgi:hypothetical protein
MDYIKEIEINEITKIRVNYDMYPPNPREDDNLGIMACMHRRYDLGDEQLDSNQFDSWVEVIKHLQREGAVVMLPLYLYDHSGITIATTPFSCPWDSGRVGFIYATAQDIREMYGVKRVTQKVKDQVTEFLKSEVKDYDKYLTGDVYIAELVVDDDVIDNLGDCHTEEYALEMGYELLDQHGIVYETP